MLLNQLFVQRMRHCHYCNRSRRQRLFPSYGMRVTFERSISSIVRTLMPLVGVLSCFLPRPKTCTPHCLQKRCLTLPVLKRYSESSSSPESTVTALLGTKRSISPFIWQCEQLHSIAGCER